MRMATWHQKYACFPSLRLSDGYQIRSLLLRPFDGDSPLRVLPLLAFLALLPFC